MLNTNTIFQCCGDGPEAEEPKLNCLPEPESEITNYGSGSATLPFIKNLKKFHWKKSWLLQSRQESTQVKEGHIEVPYKTVCDNQKSPKASTFSCRSWSRSSAKLEPEFREAGAGAATLLFPLFIVFTIKAEHFFQRFLKSKRWKLFFLYTPPFDFFNI